MSALQNYMAGRYAAVLPGIDRVLVLTGSQPQSYDRAAAYDRRTGEQVVPGSDRGAS